MLSIKTNKNNCKITYEPLNVTHIFTGSTSEDDITIQRKGHCINENDTIAFRRTDGSEIGYYNEIPVKEVIDGENFTINGFGPYYLNVDGYNNTWIRYADYIYPNEGYTELYIEGKEEPVIVNDEEITIDTIGPYNFELVKIKIGKNVKSIAEDAFDWCLKLSEITVDSCNENYSSLDGVLCSKDLTKLLRFPLGSDAIYYIIPDCIREISVSSFFKCENIECISIHDGVYKIDEYSFFAMPSLQYVTIRSEEPKTIMNNVFDSNQPLKIYVPQKSVDLYKKEWYEYRDYISDDDITVFYQTHGNYSVTFDNVITSDSIPNRNTIINVEFGTNVTDITTKFNMLRISGASIYTRIETINEETFGVNKKYPIYVKSDDIDYYKELIPEQEERFYSKSDLIGNTILYLLDGANISIVVIKSDTLDSSISENYRYTLRKAIIGSNVRTIDNNAFFGCERLNSILFNEGVTEIGNYAFYGCGIEKLSLPNSVETIGDYCFAENYVLTNIVLGKNLLTIGASAFYNVGKSKNNEAVLIYSLNDGVPRFMDCKAFSYDGGQRNIEIYVENYSLLAYKGEYLKPISLETSGETVSFLCLTLSDNHIYKTNLDNINIKRNYSWDYENNKYEYYGALTVCEGDYVTYDLMFLYEITSGTNIEMRNLEGLTITGVTSEGEIYTLNNCLIGITEIETYDTSCIYVPYSGNTEFISRFEEILANTSSFYGPDTRYLCGDNTLTYGENLQPGVTIEKICGEIEIDFALSSDFETNLLSETQMNDYVEKVKDESINKIIDYERQQFTPMFYDGKITLSGCTADQFFQISASTIDANLKRVNKLEFILNFREREYDIYKDENGDIDSINFGSWNASDYGYWNNYKLSDSANKLEYVYPNKNIYGDLLGFLGFNDDDVYYQKDALKKSFLRLSFYDSPNKENQKLLYYSTIYFDTNNLSKKYIKDLNIWRENEDYTPRYNQLVFDSEIGLMSGETLTAEMYCGDKYNGSLSSDGFYIYLFDKLISGNTCTPIYMKAEFNNAKFGKTVPLIYPVFKNSNKRIPPTNKAFPREYIKHQNSGDDIYTWVDIKSLIKDSYIKFFIKYDYKTGEYVWFIPRNGDSSTLTFELFEPRVNGYDVESYLSLIGTEVGYGTYDGRPKWFNGEFIMDNGERVWFREINDTRYSEFGGENTEQWPENIDCCCLMTTATTLASDSLIVGTKLFNKTALKKLKSIWVDGMMIYSDEYYDKVKEEYKTNIIQLPDLPFQAECINEEWEEEDFLWSPETTNELWNPKQGIWETSEEIKPKKIHRVNYYFKTNIEDSEQLLDELCDGIYNKKKKKHILKTIEATQEQVDEIKMSIRNISGETLPSGMFANVNSLRGVKTIVNKENGSYFTTIGNGAFNNCKSLVRLNIELGSIDIIGKNSFAGCSALKTAKLTDVKVILREAFQGCYTLTRTYYTVGDEAKTKYIASGAFGYTKIREVAIPNTVIRISNSAFRRCYQLNYLYLSKNGNVQWDYFWGPNTTFLGGVLVTKDEDLYTFTDGQTYQLELKSVGKRVFGDDAILKYKLGLDLTAGKNAIPKYVYTGGIPNILLELVNLGVSVDFYNAMKNSFTKLKMTTEKDRGKILYHFKDIDYRKYLEKKQYDVYNFRDWYKYIF